MNVSSDPLAPPAESPCQFGRVLFECHPQAGRVVLLETAARVVRSVEYVAREGKVRLDDVAGHKSNALRLLNTLRELDWIVVDERRPTWSART